MSKRKADKVTLRGPVNSFTLPAAAIRWAGLTGNEPQMGASMGMGGGPLGERWDPNPPVSKMDSLPEDPKLAEKFEDLRTKYGWLIEATECGELQYCGVFDEALNEEDREGYVHPSKRVVERSILKEWIRKEHPDQLPSFLFSKEERVKDQTEVAHRTKQKLLILAVTLASMGKIDLNASSAASRIKIAAENLGLEINDDTIRNYREEMQKMGILKSK